MAKSKFTKVGMLRGLIDAAYNSVPQQPQQAPSLNFGMSKADIDSIYDGYSAQNQVQNAPEIPKLEENTVTPVQNTSNPTIADELERMRKIKAENKPLSESEQRAVDMYTADLERASAPDYKPDFKAEIDRINALANDETVNWSEGEKKAREDYLTRLQNAYEEEQKKNAPVPVRSKITSKPVKTDSKKEKEVIEAPEKEKTETPMFKKDMNDSERRDFENAMREVSKARGRALSANEQRDKDRAMAAIEKAKQTTKEGSETLTGQYGDLPSDTIQTLVRTTPTPSPVSEEHTTTRKYDDRGFELNPSMDELLSTDRKLTKKEEEQAREKIKQYEQNDVNENAYTLVFDDEHPDGMMVPVYTVDENGNYDPSKELTPEQRQEQQDIYKLKSKISDSDAVMNGMMPFMPGYGLGANDAEFQQMRENSKKQNPVAYRLGNALGLATAFGVNAVGGAALEGTKYAELLDKLASGGGVAKRILAESLRDMPIDVVVDILPTLLGDINSGKSGGEIAKNNLLNVGLNALVNTAIPVVQNFGDVKSAIRGLGKQGANATGEVIEEALNPLETAAKNADISDAVSKQKQAVEEIKRLQDEIPRINEPADTFAEVDESLEGLSDIDALNRILEMSDEQTGTVDPKVFKGTKIVNKEMNDEIDTLARMYGSDSEKALIVDYKNAVNEYAQTGSEEALSRANEIATQLDNTFAGRSYKTKKGREYGFDSGHQGTFTDILNTRAEDLRNSLNVKNTVINGNDELNAKIDNLFDRFGYTDEQAAMVQDFKRTINDIVNGNASNENIIKLINDASNIMQSYKESAEYVSSYMGKKKYNNFDPKEVSDIIDEVENIVKNASEAPEKVIAESIAKNTDSAIEDKALIEQADSAFQKDTDANLYRKLMNNEITYEEFMRNAKDQNLKELASIGRSGDDFTGKAVKNGLQPYNEPVSENGDKVSRFATNSMKHGTNLTPEEYEKNIDLNQFKYESKSEKQSMEDAWKMIEDEGVDNLKTRLLSEDAKDLTQSEIDALMSITRTNNATARAMEVAGEDASALRAETNAIYKKLRKQESSNAQGLQALAKWTRNTPEGMLMHAENIVNGNLKPKKSGLQKEFDKFMKKSKDMDFSPEFESKFMEEAEKLFQLGDMDSREAKDIMARLGRLVNEQIPVKLPEKVQAYLMDNMLGNFRTLITRNAGGNVGLNAMEQLVTRPLAAAIDSGVAKVTGKRTQAGLSGKALKEYIEGFGKGLADEAHDLKTGLHTARTGENTLENAIRSNRHVFKSKVPDKLDSLVKNGLSVGDRPFYEATYKQTLGDYYRLREKGVMGDVLQNLSDEEFKNYAETAAKLNGLSAVYQNDSTISNALLKFKNAIGEFSEGTLGFDILSQFSMPFVKTPANVVDRAIDYSPLGAIRNTARTIREARGGNFDQNRFVNETARNIIGTGLMGGAGAAAANGKISGKYSDKANIKQAQKDAGQQEYAWNFGKNKKKQMDIGWIPVLGSNAVAAAAAMDAYKNGEGSLGENILSGIAAGGEALFDQSMFQGLQRLFGSGETYNSDDSLPENMMNVVKSGLGQAIPSLARQIGQVIDPYQRDIGNSNEGLSFAGMDNYDINSLLKDLPGIRQSTLAPKVDLSGNLIEENQGRNIASKILEDMILPGKITEIKENALDQEAIRLENSTGGTDAYRPKASRSAVEGKEGGESLYDNRGFELNPPKRMSNDEYVEYEQRFGKEITDVGNAVISSDIYKKADNETKESMLKEAYAAVKNSVNSDYNGKGITGMAKEYHANEDGVNTILSELEAKHNEYGIEPNAYKEMKANGEDFTLYEGYKNAQAQLGIKDNAKYREAYASGGKEGLAKEAQYQSAIKDMGVSDSKENREAFNVSGVTGIQRVANTKQAAVDSGFVDKDGQANTEAYQNAITVLGSDGAARSYKKVSDTMKQKGYTKQEQYIPYLESDGSLTDKQKGQYAYLYGNKPQEGSSGARALEKGYDYYYWYKLLQQVPDYNDNNKRDKGDRIEELYNWGFEQGTPEYDFFINSDLSY